ncbi:hypothetical protein I3843_10G119400 [Carya illinoinensis]|nr:hypothetical protein I3843_10G119400 [Carya illinoinensis]
MLPSWNGEAPSTLTMDKVLAASPRTASDKGDGRALTSIIESRLRAATTAVSSSPFLTGTPKARNSKAGSDAKGSACGAGTTWREAANSKKAKLAKPLMSLRLEERG